MRRLLARYGERPVHLVAMIVCLAVGGWVALSLIADRPIAVAVWFAGAAVLHDVLFVPVYSALDAMLRRLPRAAINYVRIPAVISGVLLLVYLPSIARLSTVYTERTGLSADGYFARWLLVTAALFAGSAVLFALRLLRVHRAGRKG